MTAASLFTAASQLIKASLGTLQMFLRVWNFAGSVALSKEFLPKNDTGDEQQKFNLSIRIFPYINMFPLIVHALQMCIDMSALSSSFGRSLHCLIYCDTLYVISGYQIFIYPYSAFQKATWL